jgi:hypothetical protein
VTTYSKSFVPSAAPAESVEPAATRASATARNRRRRLASSAPYDVR